MAHFQFDRLSFTKNSFLTLLSVAGATLLLAGCGGGGASAPGMAPRSVDNLGSGTVVTPVPITTPAPVTSATPVPVITDTTSYYSPAFPKWQHFPVRVYFTPTATMTDNKKALIQQGFDRWTQASGGFLKYVATTNPGDADVTVTFASVVSDEYGICSATYDSDGSMVRADISLAETLLATNRATTLPTIAAHEFGHALGMAGEDPATGHSDNPNDTMYRTGNLKVNAITARDLNTIRAVYHNQF